MTNYSQRDVRWSWKRLGNTSLSLGSYGCLVTAFGMLANKRPDETNTLLANKGGFTADGLVIWANACKIMGLEWGGKSSAPKWWPCIAEVRMNGVQHFVVWLGNNLIVDPWDGRQKQNPYHVVQFCNVKVPVYVPPVQNKNFTVRVDKAQAAVRTAPNVSAPLGGSQMLYRGDRFEAVGTVTGQSVSGNNVWYKSAKGNYVWSGGLSRV